MARMTDAPIVAGLPVIGNRADWRTSPAWVQFFDRLVGRMNSPVLLGGAALADPGADRVLGWDESADTMAFFTLAAGLAFSGTTITPANDLSALEALASTGLAARTGTDAWAQRTITGTANQISVSNGSGASGNPTISLAIGEILGSTWTPTLTSVANLDSTNAAECRFIEFGSLGVLCWGTFQWNPTTAGVATTMGMSLPVASDFAATQDAGGAANTNAAARGVAVYADTTNNRLTFDGTASIDTNHTFSFIAAYRKL